MRINSRDSSLHRSDSWGLTQAFTCSPEENRVREPVPASPVPRRATSNFVFAYYYSLEVEILHCVISSLWSQARN